MANVRTKHISHYVFIANSVNSSPEYYSSTITINKDGETVANYRKCFLYHTDESWALEGPDGFYEGEIPGLGSVAMGISKWLAQPLVRAVSKDEYQKAMLTQFSLRHGH